MRTFFSKFIGDKDFYKRVLIIAIPIILQQILATSYGIIDTIMVSPIERGVSGVGVASQIIATVITIVFGIDTGASIFISQFFGAKDKFNMKRSFSLGLIAVLIFSTVTTIIIFIFSKDLMMIFSSDSLVIARGVEYMNAAVFTIIPSSVMLTFAFAYRSIQKTLVPFIVSIISALLNVLFNYLLIYGIGPFEEMGVFGAGIASVIATLGACLFYVIYGYVAKEDFMPNDASIKECFNHVFFSSFFKKTIPLIINEFLFSVGTAYYVVLISKELGANAYEGYRIAENLCSMMFTVSVGLQTCIQAMVGQALGQKDFAKAKAYSRYFIVVALIAALIMSSITLIFAPQFVTMYDVDDAQIIEIAINVIRVYSLRVFLRMIVVYLYAIFRSGGESKFVMFLDCGMLWIVGIPTALIAINILHINDVAMFYLIIQVESAVRIIVGGIRCVSGKWLKNITNLKNDEVPTKVEIAK